MSVITPAGSVTSAPLNHSSSPTPHPPTFKRPLAPEPNSARDNELLNYYFDGNWTTKDIAEHFKLTIPEVAAWFQRPDIAALIDFVAAANERRARDIARESLPGTIEILQRISRLRNNDSVSRAAASSLIHFSRGPSASALARTKRAAKQAHANDSNQSTATDRSRSADPATPRGTHTPDTPRPQPPHNDTHTPTHTSDSREHSRAESELAELDTAPAPGRAPDVPRSVPPTIPHTAKDELHSAKYALEPLPLNASPPHSSAPHSLAC